MRPLILALLSLVGVAAYGCLQVQPAPAPTSVSTWGPFGGFSMSSGATCAGRATLADGYASVTDVCFTAADNIVLCTDTTTASAVRCAPGNGTLSIAGSNSDTIAYARIH